MLFADNVTFCVQTKEEKAQLKETINFSNNWKVEMISDFVERMHENMLAEIML